MNVSSSPHPSNLSREARVLLVLGAVVMLMSVLVVGWYQQRQGATAVVLLSTPIGVEEMALLIRPDSPRQGPAEAPITLVEFLDPECEACAALHPAIKQLMTAYDGRIQLIIRYFPLHSNSLLASRVTEAAGAQGKYWEMQDLLFTRRSEWAEQTSPQTEQFHRYAVEMGLNMQQFEADLNHHTFTEMVIRDSQDGVKLGIPGTPTLFLNGRMVPVEGLGYETLAALIEAELK